MQRDKRKEEIFRLVEEMDIFAKISFRSGVDMFSHFFWWDIKINSQHLKPEYKDYTDILLVPYRIDANLLKEIGKEKNGIWQVKPDCWGRNKKFPHIDIRTGNIHPIWNPKEWDGKVKQLILVTGKNNEHLGPRCAFNKGNELAEPIGGKKNSSIIYQKESKRCRVTIDVTPFE